MICVFCPECGKKRLTKKSSRNWNNQITWEYSCPYCGYFVMTKSPFDFIDIQQEFNREKEKQTEQN